MKRFIPLGAVALTLVAAPVAAATAPDHSPRPSSQSSTIPFTLAAGEFCYHNDVNDAGVAVISQNFEPDFDAYDTRGADDFTLSSRCRVKEVDVVGWYNDSGGQATSLDVRFYADHAGTPGPPIAHRHDLAYVDPTHLGSFQIPLGRPVTLRAGTYWLSVRTNMSYTTDGFWSWETSVDAKGSHAQWKNSADGFGTGCTTYTELQRCVLSGGPDFMFALSK